MPLVTSPVLIEGTEAFCMNTPRRVVKLAAAPPPPVTPGWGDGLLPLPLGEGWGEGVLGLYNSIRKVIIAMIALRALQTMARKAYWLPVQPLFAR